jgi:hypothetical protein
MVKIVAIWREGQILKLSNAMKGYETRKKLLLENQNGIIGALARLDVKTADSFNSNKDPGSMWKTPVLVLQKKCNHWGK